MSENDLDSRRVTVRRSPVFVAVAGATLVAAAGMLVFNGFAVAHLLSDRFVVAASIPINLDAAEAVIAGWDGVDAQATMTSSISAVVGNAPAEVRSLFVEAGLWRAATYGVMAVLGGVAAVLLLSGRLRWRTLPVFCVLAGVVMSFGEIASQMIGRDAVLTLSSFVQSASHWDEPGFGFGFDGGPVLTGLVIASASILFLATARFARTADGVV